MGGGGRVNGGYVNGMPAAQSLPPAAVGRRRCQPSPPFPHPTPPPHRRSASSTGITRAALRWYMAKLLPKATFAVISSRWLM